MNDDSIIKNAIKQVKDLGVETGKEFVKAGMGITKGISAGELLGDIKPMGDEELQRKKMEDEKKKKEEEQKIRSRIRGNDLEGEMKRLREESADAKAMADKQEKEKQEKEMEERKRADEEAAVAAMETSSPSKAKKKRGSAFLPNDKKSQTAEYSKKPD